MAVSWQQAQRNAMAWLRGVLEEGTPYVSPTGFEDADDYSVSVGAREFLVDGDDGYAVVDGQMTFVSKKTGAVRQEYFGDVMDKVGRMKPVPAGG